MRRQSTAAVREHGGDGRDWSAGSVSQAHSYSSRPDRRRQPRFGKVTGHTWRKTAKGSAHMLRAPKAWALDTDDLASIEALGVRYVCIHDLESLRQYWARPETLRRKGWTFNRGFGEQVALALDWWRSTPREADAVAEGLRETGPEPVGVVQGSLF